MLCVVLAVCLALPALAQEPAAAPAAPLTQADVEARVQRVQEDAALDAAIKTRIQDLYRQALADIKAADDWRVKTADWNRRREEAPQRQQEIEAVLKEPVRAPPKLADFDDTPTEAIAPLVAMAEQYLADMQTTLDAVEQESAGRVERRRQLPELTAAARQRLTEAQQVAEPAADANPEEAEALRTANRARIAALTAEIDAYNAETASYEARGRLLPLRLDQADLGVRTAEAELTALRGILAARRQQDAERAAEEARRVLMEAVDAPPAVRARAETLAQENQAFAGRRTGVEGILGRTERAEQERQALDAETARIQSEYENVVKRENAVGLNDAVGQLLRTHRANLPTVRPHSVAIKLREDAIGEAQLEQIDIEERRRELSDINWSVDAILDETGVSDEGSLRQQEDLKRLLSELLTTRKRLLDDLVADYETYITNLIELNAAERELIVKRNEFADYIDQRVLWIRSGTFISAEDFREGLDALLWLVDYETWSVIPAALRADLSDHPFVNVFALLVLGASVLLRRRMTVRLAYVGDEAEKRSCTMYRYTVEALAYTLLLSTWVPAILAFVGWRMSAALVGGEFIRVLSNGLIIVATFYLSIEFPRQVLRVKGLGESHFDWPVNAARFAKQTMAWMMPAALPVILLVALFESQEQREWRESVGRLAFFVMMVVWAYLGHRFANRRSPALQLFQVISPTGGVSSLRGLIYVLAAGAPMALAAAAALGYYYTALRIAWRIHATLTFMFLIVVGVNLAMRALMVARRKLAIEQARRKRAELKAAQKKAMDEGGEPITVVETQEPEFNLSQIDAQTTRLIRSVGVGALFAALWFTWVDFVPALRILDEIVLLESSTPLKDIANIGGGTTEGAPATAPGAVPPVVSAVDAFTLADLLLSILLLVLTIVAVRNLPGLLEIALLQRLPLAPGERYAIKTVLGYVLVLFGGILTLASLGIQWGNVQWLVAALGFGIGFGLQEIIANFISGLIILFERPIRVGDTVTIGSVSGTVSRIRIRATTITDWDMKELIVPNKEFVTGQLVNWTLSNPTLRAVIPVGVAYSSDPKVVRETLFRIADRCRKVLRQPAPQVWFTSFGDSALLFELRVYVANIEDLQPVKDELHHEIADAFREKGIEIPFPQRDVFVRGFLTPLTVRTDTDATPPKPE